LKIEDGIGFGTGGVIKSDGIDAVFGDLGDKLDMSKINQMVQQKIDKDEQKAKDQSYANAFLSAGQKT
jgi:hypothetical protein